MNISKSQFIYTMSLRTFSRKAVLFFFPQSSSSQFATPQAGPRLLPALLPPSSASRCGGEADLDGELRRTPSTHLPASALPLQGSAALKPTFWQELTHPGKGEVGNVFVWLILNIRAFICFALLCCSLCNSSHVLVTLSQCLWNVITVYHVEWHLHEDLCWKMKWSPWCVYFLCQVVSWNIL